MEHRLKDIAFYVQKHITLCTVVITSLLVRDKPLGVSASVKRVYYMQGYAGIIIYTRPTIIGLKTLMYRRLDQRYFPPSWEPVLYVLENKSVIFHWSTIRRECVNSKRVVVYFNTYCWHTNVECFWCYISYHCSLDGECYQIERILSLNTLRPRQHGRHFANGIFKCIFLNENIWISINISLNFVPNGQINNIPTSVQIMASCWLGTKPLFEPMMISLLMHICITLPQLVSSLWPNDAIWRDRSWSTLAQVMACCLTAPSHYLNQCWLIISKVQWHSSEGNFTRNNLNHQSLKFT